jgi:subtilisin family serine protease
VNGVAAWLSRQQVVPGARFDATGGTGRDRPDPVDPDPIDLVRLREVMALTSGRSDIVLGLVDGPVTLDHPDLATGNIRTVAGTAGACVDAGSSACAHGTFVAGILAARRGADAPAIAPDCTLLVRPIFSEAPPVGMAPSASPAQLAAAIVDCVDAGARLLNLSVALTGPAFGADRELGEALEHARRRGVLVITAAGNQGIVGSSMITRHRWVVPVIAYARSGRPLAPSNLGRAIGLGGLGGPGDRVSSIAPDGRPTVSSGTGVAAPFVAGSAALLWSLFPGAGAADIKRALLDSGGGRRTAIIPPLLNAWMAYQILSEGRTRRTVT